MKNYVLLLSFIFLVTSCQLQDSEKTQVKIGSELLDGNETMTPIVAGDLSTQEVWLKYIDAHKANMVFLGRDPPKLQKSL